MQQARHRDRSGRGRRAQLAIVLLLGAWWGAGGPLVSLIVGQRLPADRLSTGRIAETALGIQTQNVGLVVCVAGCLSIVGWNLLAHPTRPRPLLPLFAMLAMFGCVGFANLVATGGETRSGSRIALLLAVTIWSIQPAVRDLRVLAVTGLVIVAVSIALLPSGKTWMPAADIVLQEKALVGTQLMAGPFGQSNVLGLALAVTIPFAFLFKRVAVRLGAVALIGFFLVLSGSRSALLGVAAAFAIGVVIAMIRGRFLSGAVALIGAVGLLTVSLWLPLTTTNPQAFTQRGSIWMISRSMWGRSDGALLFGNGLGYYGIGGHFALYDHGSPTYHGHNEIVSIMTTSGLATVAAFLLVLTIAFVGALKRRGFGRRAVLVSLLVLLGCGIAETPLRIDTVDSLGWLTWFAFFAVVVAVAGDVDDSHSVSSPRSLSRSAAR